LRLPNLNSELLELKAEHKKILEENIALKKRPSEKNIKIDRELIAQIVKETVDKLQKRKPAVNDRLIKKINKNRKSILKNRIQMLAEQKKLSVSEIKDVLVDHEGLCSKATFYRYIEKMKEKGLIDLVKINDSEVVVRLN
jgi:Arc/MetJ family transcription regulator